MLNVMDSILLHCVQADVWYEILRICHSIRNQFLIGNTNKSSFGKKKFIRSLNISENVKLIGANCSRYLSSGFYRCGRYFINLGLLVPPTA